MVVLILFQVPDTHIKHPGVEFVDMFLSEVVQELASPARLPLECPCDLRQLLLRFVRVVDGARVVLDENNEFLRVIINTLQIVSTGYTCYAIILLYFILL